MSEDINKWKYSNLQWKRLRNPCGTCYNCSTCFSSPRFNNLDSPIFLADVFQGCLVACHYCGFAFVLLYRHMDEMEKEED